eukprot:365641-Chlamydomonas_euryale.AAC.9
MLGATAAAIPHLEAATAIPHLEAATTIPHLEAATTTPHLEVDARAKRNLLRRRKVPVDGVDDAAHARRASHRLLSQELVGAVHLREGSSSQHHVR